jgi:heme/copper-type cytochrome/quinol oxidase subunit 3
MNNLRYFNISNTHISKQNTFVKEQHGFHLVDSSLYPFLTSFSLLFLVLGLVCTIHTEIYSAISSNFLKSMISFSWAAGLIAFTWVLEAWFFSVTQESRYGFHTTKVLIGLRAGMLLFILSEVMFFFAFFWSFFHYSLSPSIAIGNVWPPLNTQKLDVWGLPLVNTILLLSSGVTITLAHQYVLNNNKTLFSWTLFLTIVLGICFLCCQFFEYKYGVKFSWRGNLYGSIFFITTGFHGLHVTLGTIGLLFCWARHIFANYFVTTSLEERKFWGFTSKQHFGFEAAAWYWHFVDVVWLFLFVTIYWWGS